MFRKKSEPATKADIEEQTKSFKESIGDIPGDTGIDISDQNIDALKYALHAIINNQGSIAGTTNLRPRQIHGLSRAKTLNFFYKSRAIDIYYDTVCEIQRSETNDPHNILEGIGNLFKAPQNPNMGIGNKISRIIRGR